MPARPRLTGTVFLSEGAVLYVGPLVATELHAHHAAQVVVAPAGLSVADAQGSSVMSTAVIPPRSVHGHGASDHGALLFLDGDSIPSRRLERSASPDRERWARPMLECSLPRELGPETAERLISTITRALDLELYQTARHPAVRRMCSLLAEERDASLATLCGRAGLSPRQMRHAFARDVGLSMRGYIRWLHLRRSIEVIEAGGSLSAAAIEGGFADGAHLSRVFRSHFGISPTEGLGSVRWCTSTGERKRVRR